MIRVLLCRHGQTEWNKANRVQGVTDNLLSAYGERQAEALGSFVRAHRPRLAYVSPLTRTHQTYARFGLELDPVILAGLQEQNLGDWEGSFLADLDQSELVRWRAGGFVPRGAETFETLGDRIASTFAEVVRATAELPVGAAADVGAKTGGAQTGGARIGADEVRTAVVVSHGGALRVLLERLGLIERRRFVPLTPASATVIEVAPGGGAGSIDEIAERARLRLLNLSPEMLDPGLADA